MFLVEVGVGVGLSEVEFQDCQNEHEKVKLFLISFWSWDVSAPLLRSRFVDVSRR